MGCNGTSYSGVALYAVLYEYGIRYKKGKVNQLQFPPSPQVSTNDIDAVSLVDTC